MKKNYRVFPLIILLLSLAVMAYSQGTTTSGINGKVTGANDEPLPGATILLVDVNSGTRYGTTTDLDGLYRLPNLNVGGPYRLTVSYVGYTTYELDDIYLSLGQTQRYNVKLSESAYQLKGAEIIGQREDIFDGNRIGTQTIVGLHDINTLPTVNRNITDYIRITPQAIVGSDGSITIAGMNNRYNAISFDGAVNNDVFGLASTGTNGGQTGGTPISMDAIDQFQVSLAPYDVRQGGFAGASINAVTRRGSNDFDGSVYWIYRNQNFAGKTPYAVYKDIPEYTPTKLPDFTSNLYGLRIGGPIIKNKVFFFLSAEQQRDQTPHPFDFSNYTGASTEEQIDAFADTLRSKYGYDPGGYLSNTDELNSDKILVRLDINISEKTKLMLRHQYTKLLAIDPSGSDKTHINFYNNGIYFPSVTNSSAAELKSNWQNYANSLIIGYTNVNDNRNPMGANFPYLYIKDGSGYINAGSETFSTANDVIQNILTVNDNFNIYKGRHNFVVGVNFEFTHAYNLFIRQAYGQYTYASLDDFMTGVSAIQYDRGYSLVDDIIGDGSQAAADFNVLTAGVYAQDEFQITNNFRLTGGLRFDMPVFLTKPDAVKDFDTTLAKIQAAGLDTYDAHAGKMPQSRVMLSPRVGFNWDVTGKEETQLRGGVGLFVSRLPLVWPGGCYFNNGLTVGGVFYKYTGTGSGSIPIEFRPQWDEQYTAVDFGAVDKIPSGQIDLFSENFKFPKVLRASIALDQKLFWGIVGTVEIIYTKTINNMLYYNLNESPADGHLEGGDMRLHYPGTKIDKTYTRIILGTNTSKGYTYDLTLQLTKPYSKGLAGSLAYTFGRAMSINDATSSQNSSQWRYMENIDGLNHLDLSYSDFDMGSRIIGFISYKKEYGGCLATGISLLYDGHSGKRFSYVYNDIGKNSAGKSVFGVNNEGENVGDLIYIPDDRSDINLIDLTDNDGNVILSAEQQWNDLNSFIENDKYLKKHRGGYAERNGARLPFESIFDVKIIQDFYIKAGAHQHTLEITFDVFNVANLLNKKWGVLRYITNDAYQLIRFEGYEEGTYKPLYSFTKPEGDIWNISDSGVTSSRWQGQIGIRYIFGRPN